MANPYDQIPTDGYPKAPKPDGSQNNPLNTDLGRTVTNTLNALPGAAAVPGAVAMGTGLAARALGASAPAATALGRVAQGAAPYAPVAGGAAALAGAASPAQPPASAPAPSAPPGYGQYNQGQSMGPPDVSKVPSTAPTPTPTSGNVTRVGNSYSGTNIGGDITINGQAPGGGFMVADSGRPRNLAEAAGIYPGSSPARPMGNGIAARLRAEQDANPGGQVSPQNMAAGEGLAARAMAESQARMQPQDRPRNLAEAAGIIPGQGSSSYDPNAGGAFDWIKDLRDPRNLALRNAAVGSTIFRSRAEAMMANRDRQARIAGVQAAIGGQMHDAQQADTARYQSDNSLAGNLGTEQMRQQGANQRSLWQYALDQQRVNQERETQGVQNRGRTIVQALQEQIATEQDAAKRGGIAQRLREIQGQEQADQNLSHNFLKRKAPIFDAKGVQLGEREEIVDLRTGNALGQAGQGGATTVSSPEQLAALPSGSIYTGPDGKQYRKN